MDKEAIYTSPNTDSASGASSSGAESINENNCGLIRYEATKNGVTQPSKILFSYQNQEAAATAASSAQQSEEQAVSSNSDKKTKTLFYYGDKVQFNVLTCARTNQTYAVNIKTVEQRKELGYITMLKESYGFIELNCVSNVPPANCKINTLPKDIFFHFRLILKFDYFCGFLSWF